MLDCLFVDTHYHLININAEQSITRNLFNRMVNNDVKGSF